MNTCMTRKFTKEHYTHQVCASCSTTSTGNTNWEPKAPAEIPTITTAKDDGKTTACYDIPEHAKTLDDLIEHKNMPFWLGTIFKVCYAYEERATRNVAASQLRELNKIGYYQKRGLNLLTERNQP